MRTTHSPQELVVTCVGTAGKIGELLEDGVVLRDTEETDSGRDVVNESASTGGVVLLLGDGQVGGVLAEDIESLGGVGDPVVGKSRVVNKVLSDLRVVEDDVDVLLQEFAGITDAGQHQEMGTSDTAAGEDDFLRRANGEFLL